MMWTQVCACSLNEKLDSISFTSKFKNSMCHTDIGIVLIHLPKKEKGQFFPNLGMLTTLLPRKPSNEKKSGGVVHPVMEVLEGKDHQEGVSTPSSLLRLQELEEEAFDWQVEQTISPPHVSCSPK